MPARATRTSAGTRTALVLIERVLRRRGGKLRRRRDFRLVQCPSHQGEHARIDMSRFDARGDFGLKICNQTCGVRIAPIGAIAQVLEQLLQDKQITDGKRLILAGRRHVASSAREGGKDLSRGALAVPIEIGAERRRPALGNGDRDPSRILVRRRGLWLGSAHRAFSANHSNSSRKPRPGPAKRGRNPLHKTPRPGRRRAYDKPRARSVTIGATVSRRRSPFPLSRSLDPPPCKAIFVATNMRRRCAGHGTRTTRRQTAPSMGLSFETAVHVFDDPFHASKPDPHSDGDRWHTIGLVGRY